MGRRKPGRPGITDEQANAVRGLLRQARDARYRGNATQLSLALGLTASAVSQMLSGKNRPSYDTVLLLAGFLQVDPGRVLDGTAVVQEAAPDRYPERTAALVRLRGMLPAPVEESVRAMVVHGEPFTESDWLIYALRRLKEYQQEQSLLARATPDAARGRTQ